MKVILHFLRTFSFISIFVLPAILKAQNVGIGTTSPSARLHVLSDNNNPLIIEGTPGMYVSLFESGIYRGYLGSYAGNAEDVDFGTGAANSTGKLHLTIKAVPKFTIRENGYVGINTTNPQWQLDVNGGMQLNGRLFVSGSSGTTGQVLTSNFLSPPSWQTLSSSYSNVTRFSGRFTKNLTSANDYCVMSTPSWYNLDPSNVVFASDGITLVKAGLYHFDIFVKAGYSFAATPGFAPEFSFQIYNGLPNPYAFANDEIMRSSKLPAAGQSFQYNNKFSIDLHVEANKKIKLYHSFGFGGGTSYDVSGYIAGYLISE
ncbi:MAG: hypothetical protein V4717_07400 [Bacteroidota bacterium]